MGNKKDIGKLFNERFKNFEQAPNAGLWDNIASELDQKRDRRIAPLWYYFGGLTAIIILIGIWSWQPWNIQEINSSIDNQEIVDSNPSATTNTKNTSPSNNTISDQNIIIPQENTATNNTDNLTNRTSQITTENIIKTPKQNNNSTSLTTKFQEEGEEETKLYTKRTSNLAILKNYTSLSQQEKSRKEQEAKSNYIQKIKKELDDAIAFQKEENQIALKKWLDSIETSRKNQIKTIEENKAAIATVEPEEKTKNPKLPKLPRTEEEKAKDREEAVTYKFAVSPYTSLISYGSLTKGSSIDNRLVDNPRDAISTIGYGIRADYKMSERSSIRFGIGIAPLKYRTDDFQVFVTDDNINIFQLSGINPQSLGQGGIETSPEALTFFNENQVVSIEQDISYIEVPVDYQYRFLNKRVSLSLNPGISLFVLTNNQVYATADNGASILIGRETSLKDLSLALNFSLGAHYNFTKHWRLNAEPIFKYQINPYTDNVGNFRPYYIGFQFGMSYKF